MLWRVFKILSIGSICFFVHSNEAMVRTFNVDNKDTAVLVCALQQKLACQSQQVNPVLVVWRYNPYDRQYSRKLLWLW